MERLSSAERERGVSEAARHQQSELAIQGHRHEIRTLKEQLQVSGQTFPERCQMFPKRCQTIPKSC
jgi:hypothetical protein